MNTIPSLPQLFSIKDLSVATQIPANTIRRYSRFFTGFLPYEQHGKRRAYYPLCVERLVFIQDKYKNGMSTLQVHAELTSCFSVTLPPKAGAGEKQKRIFSEIAALRKEFLHLRTNLSSTQFQSFQHIQPRLSALEAGNAHLQSLVDNLEKENQHLSHNYSLVEKENRELRKQLQEARHILGDRELLRRAYLDKC